MTSQLEMKRMAAHAALEYAVNETVIGVGSGSTVDAFIDTVIQAGFGLEGVVAASEASEARLRAAGIPVLDLFDVGGTLPVYVDGADEADLSLRLIKGAGGAMAREKVLASASTLFVCIADESKLSRTLGSVPVPVEVLPMAASYVMGQLRRLGGRPEVREGFVTDNANLVLDVTGLPVEYPETLERTIATIPGVVESGVFALRPADVLLTGMADATVRRRRR